MANNVEKKTAGKSIPPLDDVRRLANQGIAAHDAALKAGFNEKQAGLAAVRTMILGGYDPDGDEDFYGSPGVDFD